MKNPEDATPADLSAALDELERCCAVVLVNARAGTMTAAEQSLARATLPEWRRTLTIIQMQYRKRPDLAHVLADGTRTARMRATIREVELLISEKVN